MNINTITTIDEFEDLFKRNIRGMFKDEKSRNERIKKFYELIVLKKNASPLASTKKETLRRVSIVLTTKCNLKCVWCHREEQHVKDSGYLEKNIELDKLKKLLPELKGFHVLSWGGLGEPMLNKNFYEATKIARKYIPIVKTVCNGTTLPSGPFLSRIYHIIIADAELPYNIVKKSSITAHKGSVNL